MYASSLIFMIFAGALEMFWTPEKPDYIVEGLYLQLVMPIDFDDRVVGLIAAEYAVSSGMV